MKVIVWEDPQEPDAPVKVAVPAQNWFAGKLEEGLTEDQVMEMLCYDVIPEHVILHEGNRQLVRIVDKDMIPQDRTFRDAWRLST